MLQTQIIFGRLPKQDYGPSWSCSYGSWISNYLCNQCLSPLMLWAWTPLRLARCTQYNIKWCLSVTCDRSVVFSGNPVSSTTNTDRHDITEILLKVALNTISQTKPNNFRRNTLYWTGYLVLVTPNYCVISIEVANNNTLYLRI